MPGAFSRKEFKLNFGMNDLGSILNPSTQTIKMMNVRAHVRKKISNFWSIGGRSDRLKKKELKPYEISKEIVAARMNPAVLFINNI